MNNFLIVFVALLSINGIDDAHAAERQLIPPSGQRILSEARVPVRSDWTTCQKAATAGVAWAIANWQSQAILKDVIINSSTATGGNITGPPLQPYIQATMLKYGVPADIANAFASSVSNAWSLWISSLRVTGINWYPSFVCFPGPMAPPTPNIPMPLAVLTGNPEPLLAGRLKESIRTALGTRANDPRALTAINEFADGFATRFTAYRANTMITNVIGTGPVPTYAPPYGPQCGPVVNGRGLIKTGGFVGVWPAH